MVKNCILSNRKHLSALTSLPPREVLAFEYLKLVSQRFESSPDLGAALVLHVELLLQRGKELLGKQKIEDIITGASIF